MELPTQKDLFLILVITFLIFFTNTTATIDTPKAGFSLNLTFIDHENKHQNLTLVLDETKHRIDSLLNPTTIRPPVRTGAYGYNVVVGLKTDVVRHYTLQLDIAGGLTWIQCHPCNPCFVQNDPLFRPDQSSTFRPIECRDPLCRPPYRCINNRCRFDVTYAGDSSVHGELARETFHFASSTGYLEPVMNIGFGCVHESNNIQNHDASGIFSLGSSFSSFAQQLAPETHGRFSYCLYVPSTTPRSSHLLFGPDIVMRGSVQRTLLLHYPDSSMYYLDLIDLTIDATRFYLPPDTFSRYDNGHGGCMIDTSSPSSAFIEPVWDNIQHYFTSYFAGYDVYPIRGPATLCFPLKRGIERHFISMTLHFRNGANLYLRPERIWQVIPQETIFCSTLTYHRSITVIGFMQQINTRFMFDLPSTMLYFAPENC